jgi:hypothetical protein
VTFYRRKASLKLSIVLLKIVDARCRVRVLGSLFIIHMKKRSVLYCLLFQLRWHLFCQNVTRQWCLLTLKHPYIVWHPTKVGEKVVVYRSGLNHFFKPHFFATKAELSKANS